MFNIENYITPLILSKVEKFVKNVKKEELQVTKNKQIIFCIYSIVYKCVY